MSEEPERQETPEPLPTVGPVSEEVLRAEQLFQGRREIWIELNGERYRLRITRRNKLILQK
jgi:hemin uptake protein HemP